MVTKINYGQGEFLPLERSDLKTVAVAPQSLDNQWVPRSLINEMMRKKKALRDVSRRRDKAVRGEYIRALLNGEQMVINRAFLYNNPVVYHDFLPKSPDLAAFKELVAQGVIVPYLFRETTPIDQPAFGVEDGFEAWIRVAKETIPSCVRFSWQEDPNRELTREWLS